MHEGASPKVPHRSGRYGYARVSSSSWKSVKPRNEEKTNVTREPPSVPEKPP